MRSKRSSSAHSSDGVSREMEKLELKSEGSDAPEGSEATPSAPVPEKAEGGAPSLDGQTATMATVAIKDEDGEMGEEQVDDIIGLRSKALTDEFMLVLNWWLDTRLGDDSDEGEDDASQDGSSSDADGSVSVKKEEEEGDDYYGESEDVTETDFKPGHPPGKPPTDEPSGSTTSIEERIALEVMSEGKSDAMMDLTPQQPYQSQSGHEWAAQDTPMAPRIVPAFGGRVDAGQPASTPLLPPPPLPPLYSQAPPPPPPPMPQSPTSSYLAGPPSAGRISTSSRGHLPSARLPTFRSASHTGSAKPDLHLRRPKPLARLERRVRAESATEVSDEDDDDDEDWDIDESSYTRTAYVDADPLASPHDAPRSVPDASVAGKESVTRPAAAKKRTSWISKPLSRSRTVVESHLIPAGEHDTSQKNKEDKKSIVGTILARAGSTRTLGSEDRSQLSQSPTVDEEVHSTIHIAGATRRRRRPGAVQPESGESGEERRGREPASPPSGLSGLRGNMPGLSWSRPSSAGGSMQPDSGPAQRPSNQRKESLRQVLGSRKLKHPDQSKLDQPAEEEPRSYPVPPMHLPPKPTLKGVFGRPASSNESQTTLADEDSNSPQESNEVWLGGVVSGSPHLSDVDLDLGSTDYWAPGHPSSSHEYKLKSRVQHGFRIITPSDIPSRADRSGRGRKGSSAPVAVPWTADLETALGGGLEDQAASPQGLPDELDGGHGDIHESGARVPAAFRKRMRKSKAKSSTSRGMSDEFHGPGSQESPDVPQIPLHPADLQYLLDAWQQQEGAGYPWSAYTGASPLIFPPEDHQSYTAQPVPGATFPAQPGAVLSTELDTTPAAPQGSHDTPSYHPTTSLASETPQGVPALAPTTRDSVPAQQADSNIDPSSAPLRENQTGPQAPPAQAGRQPFTNPGDSMELLPGEDLVNQYSNINQDAGGWSTSGASAPSILHATTAAPNALAAKNSSTYPADTSQYTLQQQYLSLASQASLYPHSYRQQHQQHQQHQQQHQQHQQLHQHQQLQLQHQQQQQQQQHQQHQQLQLHQQHQQHQQQHQQLQLQHQHQQHQHQQQLQLQQQHQQQHQQHQHQHQQHQHQHGVEGLGFSTSAVLENNAIVSGATAEPSRPAYPSQTAGVGAFTHVASTTTPETAPRADGTSKRKRGGGAEPQLEQQPQSEGPPPERKRQATSRGGERRLACPFLKNDPDGYKDKMICLHGWSTVHRVKEHIYRNHLEYPCERCGEVFGEKEHLKIHIRLPQRCGLAENKSRTKGVSPERAAKLRRRDRAGPGVTEEAKWRKMYLIIFWEAKESDVPSAYRDCDLADYRQYLCEEGPPLLRQAVEHELRNDPQGVDQDIKDKMIAIFERVQVRVLNDYMEKQKGTGLASPESTEPSESSPADTDPLGLKGNFDRHLRDSPALC